MNALLNYTCIRITFSCPGSLDVEQIPNWIEIEGKEARKHTSSRSIPFFSIDGGLLPSGMLNGIFQTDLTLARMKVKERMRENDDLYALFSFTFLPTSRLEKEHIENGNILIHNMLSLPWGQARMYQYSLKVNPTLNISLIRQVSIPTSQFEKISDKWGIRHKK